MKQLQWYICQKTPLTTGRRCVYLYFKHFDSQSITWPMPKSVNLDNINSAVRWPSEKEERKKKRKERRSREGIIPGVSYWINHWKSWSVALFCWLIALFILFVKWFPQKPWHKLLKSDFLCVVKNSVILTRLFPAPADLGLWPSICWHLEQCSTIFMAFLILKYSSKNLKEEVNTFTEELS